MSHVQPIDHLALSAISQPLQLADIQHFGEQYRVDVDKPPLPCSSVGTAGCYGLFRV